MHFDTQASFHEIKSYKFAVTGQTPIKLEYINVIINAIN